MRLLPLSLPAVWLGLCLAAVGAVRADDKDSKPADPAEAACPVPTVKVCAPAAEGPKIKKVVHGCKCEDFCEPPCCCGWFGWLLGRGGVTCGDAGCSPGGSGPCESCRGYRVRTRRVLLKKAVTSGEDEPPCEVKEVTLPPCGPAACGGPPLPGLLRLGVPQGVEILPAPAVIGDDRAPSGQVPPGRSPRGLFR